MVTDRIQDALIRAFKFEAHSTTREASMAENAELNYLRIQAN